MRCVCQIQVYLFCSDRCHAEIIRRTTQPAENWLLRCSCLAQTEKREATSNRAFIESSARRVAGQLYNTRQAYFDAPYSCTVMSTVL